MAGIDNLKARILRDSQAEAERIERDARAKADQIIESAKAQAEALLEETKAKSERDGKDKRDRIIARAQLDSRNAVLESKQQAIDKILETTLQRIYNMSNEEYSKLIEELLISSVETGTEEVVLSIKDRSRISRDVISRVNSILFEKGKIGNIRLSDETRNIASGFILKREGLEINCTFESRIRDLREEIQGDLAKLLFD